MNVVKQVRGALRWATQSNLRLFFFITLGWTWIIGMIPVMLGINNTDHGNLIFMLSAGIAPSCVGLIMVFTTYSPEARKDFFRRFIPQWEHITGRPAPAPALLTGDATPRPAPAFVEWLMGLQPGWVTDSAHELTHNQQLTALGNGVLPLQGIAALDRLAS